MYGQVFGAREGSSDCPVGELRIEEIALHAKWCFADGVLAKIHGSSPDDAEKVISALCDGYVNYIRNDGSGAFRIALEWLLARNSAFEALADWLERFGFDDRLAVLVLPGASNDAFPGGQAAGLQASRDRVGGNERVRPLMRWPTTVVGDDAALRKVVNKVGRCSPEERMMMARYFKTLAFLDTEDYSKRKWASVEDNCRDSGINGVVEKVWAWLVKHVTEALDIGDRPGAGDYGREFLRAPLGTIGIGMVRPQFIADMPGDQGLFSQALQRVREDVDRSGAVVFKGIPPRLRTRGPPRVVRGKKGRAVVGWVKGGRCASPGKSVCADPCPGGKVGRDDVSRPPCGRSLPSADPTVTPARAEPE